MSDEDPKKGKPGGRQRTSSIAGRDEMYTVRRQKNRHNLKEMSAEEREALIDFITGGNDNDEIETYALSILDDCQERLHMLGLPRAAGPVEAFRKDGVEHWRERYAEPGTLDFLRLLQDERVEHGVTFILSRVPALSEPWWLAHLTKLALTCIEETDSNRRAICAFRLGHTYALAKDHIKFLPDVVDARTTRRTRSEGGRATRHEKRDEILRVMNERVKRGATVRGAAKYTFETKKLGSSIEANVAIFNRAKKVSRR